MEKMSDQIRYWSDMTTHEGHHGGSVYGNIYQCDWTIYSLICTVVSVYVTVNAYKIKNVTAITANITIRVFT